MKQQTIKREIATEGVGIHRGSFSKIFLYPAPPDSGIVFVKNGVRIEAKIENAKSNYGNTILSKNGESVSTVEHILATFYGLGVDNCICEISGDEVPALDGSAMEYVHLIEDSGIIQLDKDREIKNIKKSVAYQDEGRQIFALPHKSLQISYLMDYGYEYPPPQFKSLRITPEVFEREIAPARTHTFYRWIEEIRKKGLGKGGSLDNVLVIGEKGLLNKEPLRFPDEFVRHKMLDLI